MHRAIVRVIAWRAGWTVSYMAAVFLLVSALAYYEWKWETTSWSRGLNSPRADARAQAMAAFGLREGQLPQPVPCHSLVRGLSDVPQVRREAISAVIRVVRRGHCIDNVIELLRSNGELSARTAAARALAFMPAIGRAQVIRILDRVSVEPDSAGMAATETLRYLESASR